ncbi:MAG: hypothetical protein K2I70_00670, partial [Bacilli bacterium]|nr:hypothetical protein [Bacilli bacterium]
MKSLKRVSKTLIFTLLLLLAFMFSSYGKSGAKYYKDEKDSVTYNLGFEALTKVGNGVFSLDYTKSKHDLAYFEYSVPRNNIMTQEDSSDTYRVIVNEGCEIKEINNTVISNGTNTATYVYNNNLAGSISVKYSCPVEKILLNNSTELFNTTVTIREQMSTDYKEFKYLSQVSDTLKVSTSLPPEEAANPDVLTILENDTEVEVLTKINQWLTYKVDEYKKNNSASTGFSADLNPTDLLSYFKKGYPDGDIRNFDTTLVQNIKVTKANGTYVFELDDDFMAYALTDTKVNSSSTFKVFYFADMTKTDAELEALFEYYVDKYVFNKNSQNYTYLMNYINANGGIVAM